ncbi:hypothetical protein HG531_003996 [Fusarium graminearum]|nr:hypothetical protein HG531_003996 [Fusarium graminearum]
MVSTSLHAIHAGLEWPENKDNEILSQDHVMDESDIWRLNSSFVLDNTVLDNAVLVNGVSNDISTSRSLGLITKNNEFVGEGINLGMSSEGLSIDLFAEWVISIGLEGIGMSRVWVGRSS